jgi:glyoxylase-like metal-dependent hydrolase (beta-lactamase superfamily II)
MTIKVTHRRVALVIPLLVVVGPLALYSTCTAAPLPAPPPTSEPLPPAYPPQAMAIYQLPTGLIHRTVAFAYAGGSLFDRRNSAVTAVLVKHPRGDLLIDAGFGHDIDRQFRLESRALRMITRYERLQPAADQLQAMGYPRSALRAILLTHAHWDHVSGVADFPGTPVWVTRAERRYITDGGVRMAVARSEAGARDEDYDFDDTPYFGFPRSRDIYGDGSIVVVPSPGHTPGSVIIFVTLPTKERYAFVGDLVWQLEGITLRRERPWLMRRSVDVDEEQLRASLLHMIAIHERYPEIAIVPAHDQRAYAGIPRLPSPEARP